MAEFEDKLNSILSNQAAMNQIMALARSLSGEQAETPPALEPPAEHETTYVPAAGDPAQLMAMMDQLMRSKEGAELVNRIDSQAKQAGLN